MSKDDYINVPLQRNIMPINSILNINGSLLNNIGNTSFIGIRIGNVFNHI